MLYGQFARYALQSGQLDDDAVPDKLPDAEEGDAWVVYAAASPPLGATSVG